MLDLAYFGLPLGALLLIEDGHHLNFAAIPAIAAPGLRRLRRRLGERVIELARVGDAFDGIIDERLQRRPDLIVSWFWPRKLPARWLSRATRDAIGAHPSLLPRHRGRNPYFWAIDSGDDETGVTVHRLEAEYDTGAILHQRTLPVGERNAWQLARALDRPSLSALRAVVGRYAAGERPAAREQDEALVTFAPEPTDESLRADFSWPTARVLRRIRALSSVPGLALELLGLRFFVTRARATESFVAALLPGEAQLTDQGLLLRTGDSALWIERAVLLDPDAEDADNAQEQQLDARDLVELLRGRLGSRPGHAEFRVG